MTVCLPQSMQALLNLAVSVVLNNQQWLVEENRFSFCLGHAVLVDTLPSISCIPLKARYSLPVNHVCILLKYTFRVKRRAFGLPTDVIPPGHSSAKSPGDRRRCVPKPIIVRRGCNPDLRICASPGQPPVGRPYVADGRCCLNLLINRTRQLASARPESPAGPKPAKTRTVIIRVLSAFWLTAGRIAIFAAL